MVWMWSRTNTTTFAIICFRTTHCGWVCSVHEWYEFSTRIEFRWACQFIWSIKTEQLSTWPQTFDEQRSSEMCRRERDMYSYSIHSLINQFFYRANQSQSAHTISHSSARTYIYRPSPRLFAPRSMTYDTNVTYIPSTDAFLLRPPSVSLYISSSVSFSLRI